MKRFINVLGVTLDKTDEIMLMAYGSRGGMRAALDPAAARTLRDNLTIALGDFERVAS